MPKTSLPLGGGGVDAGPVPGQHLEADAACGQVMHRVDQVPQIAAQPVELPDDQRIALPQRLEAGGQAGPVIPLAGGGVFIEVPGIDACGEQGIALQVGDLAAVRLAHPHVPDQHLLPLH